MRGGVAGRRELQLRAPPIHLLHSGAQHTQPGNILQGRSQTLTPATVQPAAQLCSGVGWDVSWMAGQPRPSHTGNNVTSSKAVQDVGWDVSCPDQTWVHALQALPHLTPLCTCSPLPPAVSPWAASCARPSAAL